MDSESNVPNFSIPYLASMDFNRLEYLNENPILQSLHNFQLDTSTDDWTEDLVSTLKRKPSTRHRAPTHGFHTASMETQDLVAHLLASTDSHNYSTIGNPMNALPPVIKSPEVGFLAC
jgi:hypothetical protein